MRTFFTILFNLFLWGNISANSESKCKLDFLLGEWYGEFEYLSDGSQLTAVFEVTETKGCDFFGTIYVPEFFNSTYEFVGNFKDDTLVFEEFKIKRGKEILLNSKYYLTNNNDGLLGGKCIDNAGNYYASISLTYDKKLSHEDSTIFQKIIANSKKDFGNCFVLSVNSEISLEKLKEEHNKRYAYEMEDGTCILYKGQSKLAEMSMETLISYVHPNKHFSEISLENISFLTGSDGKISWTYNSLEDKLQIEDVDSILSLEMLESSTETLNALESREFVLTDIYNSDLNGIKCYRLVFKKGEDNIRVLFMRKDDFQIVRDEKQDEILEFLEYKQLGQYNLVTKLKQMSFDEVLVVDFNEISFCDKNDLNFSIPDSLAYKAKKNALTANDYNLRGNKFLEEGNYQNAIEEYNKAITNNPNSSIFYLNRCKAKSSSGDYYGAITDCSISIQLDPKLAEAHNFLGLCKYNLGDFNSAIKDFSNAIELESEYEIAIKNRGMSYYNLGNNEMGLKDYLLLTEIDSSNGEYIYSVGYFQTELKLYDNAITSITKALSLGFTEAYVYNYRGIAHYRNKNYQLASEDFEMAISLDTTDYVKYSNLGQAYYYVGNYKLSIKALEQSLKLNYDDSQVFNYIGLNYFKLGHYESALRYFEKAIEIRNNYATYFDNKAFTQIELGNYEEAIKDFNHSINLYADDSEVYYQRGLLHIKIHNRYKGCLDFEKARELGHTAVQEVIDEYCVLENISDKSREKNKTND